MLRKSLLACGVLASVLYVGIDVVAAVRYPAYHSFTSRAVSELMASGAPTERLVDPLLLLYDALMMAFGVGVWRTGPGPRARITGGVLFAYAAIGLLGPTLFEMNVRGTGGDPTADLLHIALTVVMVLLMFTAMGFGASIRGRGFRVYTVTTALLMIALGVLTSLSLRGVGAGEPTPWVGALERILIGAFLLWVGALAASLWRLPATNARAGQVPASGEPPRALPAE